MYDYKKILAVVMIISTLALSACSAQLDVGLEGQVNQENGSGSLDLNVGLTDPENQQSSQNSESDSQQNQQITLQSDGLLIIIGLGLLVLIGLLAGLLRSKGTS